MNPNALPHRIEPTCGPSRIHRYWRRLSVVALMGLLASCAARKAGIGASSIGEPTGRVTHGKAEADLRKRGPNESLDTPAGFGLHSPAILDVWLARPYEPPRRAKLGETTHPGDHYRISFANLTDEAHYYVYQVDSKGRHFLLHPRTDWADLSFGANPVKTGQSVLLPSRDKWYQFDDVTGEERIRAIVSKRPLNGLLEMLRLREAGETAGSRADSVQKIAAPEANDRRGIRDYGKSINPNAPISPPKNDAILKYLRQRQHVAVSDFVLLNKRP